MLFGVSVVVAETETGRERFRVGIQNSQEFFLSGDGRTLVSIHRIPDAADRPESTQVRIWDVYPHRAWFWAVASSSATGVVLLLLRRWWLKRKAARQVKAVS